MKIFPQAWSDKLTAGATNFATLWHIRRQDGVEIALTDYWHDISWDGRTFVARPGYERSSLRYEKGLKEHNIEIDAGLIAGFATAKEFEIGVFDRAILTVWLVDYTDPQPSPVVLIKGSLGKIEIKDETVKLEVVSITNAYGSEIMRVYTPLCSADLGDARCGVSVPKEVKSVAEVISEMELRMVEGTGQADSFFDDGVAVITAGNGTGARADIKHFDPATGRLSLWAPFTHETAAGDQVELQAGCNKTLDDCRNKFGNLLNFRGFPYIPGTTKLARFPDAK